jgi:hypothetical protein
MLRGPRAMSAIEYNERQVEQGNLTGPMLVALTEHWQGDHELQVDGFCGPLTQASIVEVIFGDGGASPLGQRALEVAIREIGNGEEGGNNSGPQVAKYHGIQDDGDPDDDGSWCASFVSWCFEEAARELGVSLPFERSGGAKQLFRNITSTGEVVSKALPGDVVLWDRGEPGSWQGHIGIVEHVEGGLLHTLEGNVGAFPARVRRMTHDLKVQTRLEGFGRAGDGD